MHRIAVHATARLQWGQSKEPTKISGSQCNHNRRQVIPRITFKQGTDAEIRTSVVCSEVARNCPSLISLYKGIVWDRYSYVTKSLCDQPCKALNKGLHCELIRIFSIVPAITFLTYKAWPDTQDTIPTIVQPKRYLNAIFAVP